jgi:hypothetical protein
MFSVSLMYELEIAIIGIIVMIVLAAWGFFREKPKLKVDVLSCKHGIRRDREATLVRIEFKVHNKGNKPTTLTKLQISFKDYKGNQHEATEDLKTDVDAGKSTQDPIEIWYTFSPPFEYAETFPCDFTLYHTHNKKSFKAESRESKTSLDRFGVAVIDW